MVQQIARTFFITTIFVVIVIFFTSCGYQAQLRRHCHMEGQTCDNLFGVNQEEIDANQNLQLAAQQKEIDSLTTMMQELVKDSKAAEADYNQMLMMINMLHTMAQQQGADINVINQMLADMNQDLEALEESISRQQAQINALAIDVANLQNQGNGVIETVYPCGDSPGKFDEALIRLSSGKLLAYFEEGNNRFLTELKAQSYRTTDYAPYCHFNVNANNEIVSAKRQ